MARPKLKYFRFREVGNAIELVCLFSEVTSEVETEAVSVFAMLYYQTRNHIKLDLYSVDFVPLGFFTRILNLAKDLRNKKRVLILLGIRPSIHHFLHRFHLHQLVFLQEEDLIRPPRKKPKVTALPAKEESLGESLDPPREEGA